MRSFRTVAVSVFVSLVCGATAFADVQVSIPANGRISIVAKDASVAQILAEWARIGRTTIVNGEKIPRDHITMELEDVSEEEALEIVLRTASGYLAAPRAVAVPNASRFDRIVVMPPSLVQTPPPPGQTAMRVAAPPAATSASATPAYPVPTYQAPEYPQPPPVAAPEPAYDSSSDATTGGDEPTVMVVGVPATPTPVERVQATFRARTALETVDPRSIQMPALPQGNGAGALPRGVAAPGMIVQPPMAQPRQPGVPPGGRE